MRVKEETWQNQLLQELPAEVWIRWEGNLEPAYFEAGEVIYEIGDALRHVYFPTSAILSLTHVLHEGGTIEIAMVGSEGMSGISIFMGGGFSIHRVVALRSGKAFRVRASWLAHELTCSPLLMQRMLRFTQSLITQMSQVSACSHHHSLEQQFSRWLLSYADRTHANLVTCTQETVANLLGVRRERMAKAANNLQKLGLIQYSRGKIHLINRTQLEQHTCECYLTVRSEYERLSPLSGQR